jgi:hypothetical protein
VLHLAFHDAGTTVRVWSNDRYAFLDRGSGGILIDERTGRRTLISRPGCNAVAIGGPWLLFSCSNDNGQTVKFELYALSGAGSRPFTLNPDIVKKWCGTDTSCHLDPIGVGTNWVKLLQNCAKCGFSYVLQNIGTATEARDPTGRTTVADLNSPTLVRKVCSPLSVPHADVGVEDPDLSGWGSLTFYGPFALAAGYQGIYLERCGSRMRAKLLQGPPMLYAYPYLCQRPVCPPAANSDAVVWQSGYRRLSGVLLPSLRRFVVPVPAAVDTSNPGGPPWDDTYAITLCSRTLYLLVQGRLWTAARPALPRPTRK